MTLVEYYSFAKAALEKIYHQKCQNPTHEMSY